MKYIRFYENTWLGFCYCTIFCIYFVWELPKSPKLKILKQFHGFLTTPLGRCAEPAWGRLFYYIVFCDDLVISGRSLRASSVRHTPSSKSVTEENSVSYYKIKGSALGFYTGEKTLSKLYTVSRSTKDNFVSNIKNIPYGASSYKNIRCINFVFIQCCIIIHFL